MTRFRDWAAQCVSQNWRIRRRLPRVTAYARAHAYLMVREDPAPVSAALLRATSRHV